MTTPIPTTDAALTLHQWLSPAFPVGAFAWSHGLEAEVAAGRVTTAARLTAWLETLLRHGSGRSDAILLAAAFRAEESDTLADIADLAQALAPSGERRAETLTQGRAFAATVSATHGIAVPPMAYPVAVGRAAALCHLPLDLTLRLYLQAVVGNLVSAAVRLVPLGQTEGQGALAALAPAIASVAAEAEAATLDDVGSAAVRIDLASMRHEAALSAGETRLFRS